MSLWRNLNTSDHIANEQINCVSAFVLAPTGRELTQCWPYKIRRFVNIFVSDEETKMLTKRRILWGWRHDMETFPALLDVARWIGWSVCCHVRRWLRSNWNLKYGNFVFRKCLWKCCLKTVSHFVNTLKSALCSELSLKSGLEVAWGYPSSWWRHQMETFSALLAFCAGSSSVTGQFPSQRPVTRCFGVFFDLCLNKQSRRRWFGMPSH